MAIQQVNLYLPELRPSKEWLTLSTLVLCVAGLLAIFIVSALASHFALTELEQQVATVEEQLTRSQLQVKSIRGRIQPLKTNNLQVQVAYLKAAIRGREQVGQIIAGQNLGNADGFSDYFQAIAELANSDLSLQRIKVSDGGQLLELQGQTRKPMVVAEYLRALHEAPAFSATHFGLLSLAKHTTQGGIHQFSLGFEPVYKQAATGARND